MIEEGAVSLISWLIECCYDFYDSAEKMFIYQRTANTRANFKSPCIELKPGSFDLVVRAASPTMHTLAEVYGLN